MTTESRTREICSSAAVGTKTTAEPIVFTVLLGRACAWLLTCAERRRQRIALAALNDRMLADLGLSQSDVSRESAKWPWQP